MCTVSDAFPSPLISLFYHNKSGRDRAFVNSPILGPKCGHTKTPAQHDTVREHETRLQLAYWYISHPKPDLPGGGATLFLAGEDHGYYEKAK